MQGVRKASRLRKVGLGNCMKSTFRWIAARRQYGSISAGKKRKKGLLVSRGTVIFSHELYITQIGW